MKTLLTIFFSLGLLIGTSSANETFTPDTVTGYWFVEGGEAKMQIYRRGDKYYGKLAWLAKPNYPNGEPKVDKNNPDEELRNQPVLGLEIMKGFEYDADDNEYDDGKIYDPESGNTYSAYMKLIDRNALEVRGYIGFSLIGRSQTWKRADN